MKNNDELLIPADARFTPDHEWISVAAPYRVGVSDFAQDQLGDLTYVELPVVGQSFTRGVEFGTLESAKSASALMMPVAGTVRAVNDALGDDPGLVNRDPHGEGWLIEIDPADPADIHTLMDADAYRAFLLA